MQKMKADWAVSCHNKSMGRGWWLWCCRWKCHL